MATKNQKEISDLSIEKHRMNQVRRLIDCHDFQSDDIHQEWTLPIFVNATHIMLIESGWVEVSINYRIYRLTPHTLVLLSASHLFYLVRWSEDFRFYGLLVSRTFMEEMDTTDMIYRRIRYGVKLYQHPIIALTKIQSALLLRRMERINESIENSDHLYQKELILNTLYSFYLETSNIIDRQKEFKDENMTRQEHLIKSFIELLVEHFRQEHSVDFYAQSLNISPHHLTLIVKQNTGQTASGFITDMLFGEARHLLQHTELSIQEIALQLNFADQSSFGKFFKRKATLSPADFRKQIP